MRSRPRGFTLTELLVVVLIIGVLAAIAIPRFGRTKDKAYVATMLSDLKNLATAQGSYFADNQTYTSAMTTAQFRHSAGVTITITTSGAGATGWSATASHGATTRTCTITSEGSGANDGQPVCN